MESAGAVFDERPVGAGSRRGGCEPAIADLARSRSLVDLATAALRRPAFPVRAILFEKSPDANWFVGWHQDTVVPIAERRPVPGYSRWTVKDGVHYARPPVSVLESMVALRVHLDEGDRERGALQVLPGTHRFGYLSDEAIRDRQTGEAQLLCAGPGDVVLIKPLVLHASRRMSTPGRRRVVHVEFAAEQLPGGGGLCWADFERP